MKANGATASVATAGASVVLISLAAGQFLMALDMSVMNVSIATVANDIGTTVTGIQTAITLYTLVMASLMILGGKIGSLIGSRKAFQIGLVIYASGSLTTALAPNLGVLIVGWSLLEGIGAVLIMPAIVALVAGNFPPERRTAVFGLIFASAAMAVAAGPLIGGAATTFFSWRWVFVGEVVVAAGILLMSRQIVAVPPQRGLHIDLFGAALSAAGLFISVYGVLRTSEWGWVRPKEGGPDWLGMSPSVWLILGGLLLLWTFTLWERRVERHGGTPLIHLSMFGNRQLAGGLTLFGLQFFIQSGVFFVVPLFLSVVLELSAIATGLRLLPLSFGLLLTAAGLAKIAPNASPRTIVRLGLGGIIAGTVVMISGLDPSAEAAIVMVPLFVIGLGVGALASQLGGVTVSAVSEGEVAEVGGLQNTATQLGASLSTALVGSILIATLSATLVTAIQEDPSIPPEIQDSATVQLASGAPFMSSSDLKAKLDELNVPSDVADSVIKANEEARPIALQAAMLVVAVAGVIALFFTGPFQLPLLGDAPTSDRTSS